MEHKHISPLLVLFCCSLILNLTFVGLIYKYEHKSHWLQRQIESKILNIEKDEFVDRPDFWCIQGWNNTVKKLDIKCDVLFFGHSQIAMSDFRKYFPEINIVNSGYPGDNVEGMRLRVEQIEALKPKKIFLMCGVNSLWMNDDVFMAKYDLLINDIQTASPESQLYIFNILPECDGSAGSVSINGKISHRNDMLAEYAKVKCLQLIDLHQVYEGGGFFYLLFSS